MGRELPAIPEAIRRFLADASQNGIVEPAVPAATPLISVIIPVFNGTRFLPSAVQSVLAQDYPSLDIIVSMTRSTEDIAAAVPLAAGGDTAVPPGEQKGPAAARNRGIREATGELLAFLDVDDEWTAGNLRHMSTVLAKNNRDIVIGHSQLVRDGADGRGRVFLGSPLETFPWSIEAALFRRETFAQIGVFDESLRFGEDADWFNRAEEAALAIERLPNICVLVRRHAGNMTHGKDLVELNTVRVLKKSLDRRRGREKSP